MDFLVNLAILLAIIVPLVLAHEVGHFVMARRAGVTVHEFGIGFPPRALVLHRGKGTIYSLNWLPIGGFVKLEGEDGSDADDPRSFSSQRYVTKMLILVAGVAMNVVLAFAIFTGIALYGDPAVGVKVSAVQDGSPAAAAGIVAGDTIVTLDGQQYVAFGPARPLEDLQARAGETVTLGVKSSDGTVTPVQVTLRPLSEQDATHKALGIESGQVILPDYVHYSVGEAVRIGAQRTVDALGLIVGGLASLVTSVAADPTAAPPVSGPVGIAASIGDVFWQLGPLFTLYVAGVLSANLAVVNILPFPPLDGGRMLVILLKAIPRFGQRISLRAEQLTYAIGFVALFTFLIWITVFDIAKQVSGTP
jgi:regulator of sigma E protease